MLIDVVWKMKGLLLLIGMSQIPKHLCIDAIMPDTDMSRRDVWGQRLAQLHTRMKNSAKLREVVIFY